MPRSFDPHCMSRGVSRACAIRAGRVPAILRREKAARKALERPPGLTSTRCTTTMTKAIDATTTTPASARRRDRAAGAVTDRRLPQAVTTASQPQGYVRRPAGLDEPGLYALTVEGGCMSPRLHSGQVAIFSPTQPCRPGDLVALHPTDGSQPQVKQLRTLPGQPIGTPQHPDSTAEHAVMVAQINPPHTCTIRIGQLKAMHRMVGIYSEDGILTGQAEDDPADTNLLRLGDAMEASWTAEAAAYAAAPPDMDHPAAPFARTTGAMVDEIERTRAHTLPGLLVKARALRWCRADEPFTLEMFESHPLDDFHATDERVIVSILTDLHTMTAKPRATGQDDRLLALIAEAEAIDAEGDRLWSLCPDVGGRHPAYDAWDAHNDATRPRWLELVTLIDAAPARTPEGLRAKARYALVCVPGETKDSPDPCDTLAWSALRDVIGAPAHTLTADADLLTAFREWQPQERERQAVAAIYRNHPEEYAPNGRHIADDRYDAWHKGWHDLVDKAIKTPAHSPEGIQAKATMLRAMLEHDGIADIFDADDTTVSDVLTWSLVRDVLAGAAT